MWSAMAKLGGTGRVPYLEKEELGIFFFIFKLVLSIFANFDYLYYPYFKKFEWIYLKVN